MEELLIFLLTGSVIIFTLLDIITRRHDSKSALSVQSLETAVYLICSIHIFTVEPINSTEM